MWYLADPRRSYTDVATEFHVSRTSVAKHAKSEDWRGARDEQEARAREGAARRVARSREERISKVLLLTDLVVDGAYTDLTNGAQKAELARVPEFVKLAELLEGKPTDHVTYEEQLAGLRVALGIAARYVPKAKRAEFLAEVNEALGTEAEVA